MTDDCPDFDQTLRNLLSTPPVSRSKAEPVDDQDDIDEPQEQDANSNCPGE